MDPDHSRSRTTGAVDQKTKSNCVFPNRSPPSLSPAEKHRFNGASFRKTEQRKARLCVRRMRRLRHSGRQGGAFFCFPICCVLRIQELLLFRKN